jgi:hypothetical protein
VTDINFSLASCFEGNPLWAINGFWHLATCGDVSKRRACWSFKVNEMCKIGLNFYYYSDWCCGDGSCKLGLGYSYSQYWPYIYICGSLFLFQWQLQEFLMDMELEKLVVWEERMAQESWSRHIAVVACPILFSPLRLWNLCSSHPLLSYPLFRIIIILQSKKRPRELIVYVHVYMQGWWIMIRQ